MVHIIDLRDHFHMKGDHDVTGDWLEGLRYPAEAVRRDVQQRSTNINRLRASEWLDVFADAGFETEYEERKIFPLPSDFDPRSCRHGGRDSTAGTRGRVPDRRPAQALARWVASAVRRAVSVERP